MILAQPQPDTVALHRYWNGRIADHFYTTSPGEIGTIQPGTVGKYGYVYEGVVGYLFALPTIYTIPLHRFWNGKVMDHMYSVKPKEVGSETRGVTGPTGYVNEGIIGHAIEPSRFYAVRSGAMKPCHMTMSGHPRNVASNPPTCSPDTTRLSVRCCAKDGSRVPMVRYGCNTGMNYDQAVKICAQKRLRLCSLQEIKQCATCGTGCGYDMQRIWTSSTSDEASIIKLSLACTEAGQAAVNAARQGSLGNPIKSRQYVDTATSHQFVDMALEFKAKGQVKGWSVFAHQQGPTKMQVYRPLGNNQYQLIGETPVAVSGPGIIKVAAIPPIEVEQGDVIGWRDSGTGVISFDFAGPNVVRWFGGPPATVGGPALTFASSQNRIYSVQAVCVDACPM